MNAGGFVHFSFGKSQKKSEPKRKGLRGHFHTELPDYMDVCHPVVK
jgi:hypothetical protein